MELPHPHRRHRGVRRGLPRCRTAPQHPGDGSDRPGHRGALGPRGRGPGRRRSAGGAHRPPAADRRGRRGHRRRHQAHLPVAGRARDHRGRPVDEPVDPRHPRRRRGPRLRRGRHPAEQQEHPAGGGAGGRAVQQVGPGDPDQHGGRGVRGPAGLRPGGPRRRERRGHGGLRPQGRARRGDPGRARRRQPGGPHQGGRLAGPVAPRHRGPADTLPGAACDLLDALVTDEHELVTVIEGDGSGAAATRTITEWLAEHRPGADVEVHHGGQPLYPYLFSIE